MAIPKEKLETWASQGAIVTSQSTHEAVRNALNASEDLQGVNFKVYLQGSYRNSTNIRGESDVDIIVQLNKTYTPYISELPTEEQKLYNSAHTPATYHLSEFRKSVLEALKAYFGSLEISEGDKCIKVKKNSNRLDADIVVCNQYRKYKQFISFDNSTFDEGIIFYTKSGRTIIGYPKIHYKNGSNKNSDTNRFFKPNVRIFKNARSHLITNGIIDESLAPSFFVECLLYNIPNHLFVSNYSDTYLKVISWLADIVINDEYDTLMCQDEQLQLFGDSPEQWNKEDAAKFIIESMKLWKDW